MGEGKGPCKVPRIRIPERSRRESESKGKLYVALDRTHHIKNVIILYNFKWCYAS
jgi:hypothetical protein